MKLTELQDILGERIKVTLSEMTPEEREIANAQTDRIIGLGKQMINNGDLILRAEKLMAETKALETSVIKSLIY